MKNYILRDRRLSIASKIIIVFLWISLSRLVDNQVILPSITSTFRNMLAIIEEPDFLTIITYTLARTLIGFFISLTLALVTGIISSISKLVYNMMVPLVKFLNSVPTIAIIVLALIWLNNEIVPIFVGFIMVFPVVYETVLNSILDVDQKIIQMAKLYKVGRLAIVKKIYLPSILYSLSSVFHLLLGINLKMVIAGEVLGQPKYGIGSNLQLERIYLNTPGVFAWIVIILLISMAFDYMIRALNYSLGVNRWK